VVVGAGYVGLVNAAGFAHHGHEVWCVDIREDWIASLRKGQAQVSEPGLADVLAEHAARLHFGTSLPDALRDSRAKLVLVAVGTPSCRDGKAELRDVRRVVREIPAESRVAVVMKSTVLPLTGSGIMREAASNGQQLVYVSCPEFLREGQAMRDFSDPDRVVVGGEQGSWEREAVCKLHEPIVGSRRIFKTSVTSAEMIKHASNFELALRISSTNQIANVCEEVGADISEVMTGVGRDRRIGAEFLEAGVGFGGSCFDKDVKAFSWIARAHGCPLTLGDTLLEINEGQVHRVIHKLQRHIGQLEGRTVALLGLTFKPQTDDLRNGPAFAIARLLRRHGAVVRAYDPNAQAREKAIHNANDRVQREWIAPQEMACSALDALEDADACVLVTGWEDFKEIDWNAAAAMMVGDLVIDGRNALDPDRVRSAGLTYEGTGRLSAGLAAGAPAVEPAS
jgi:UDPglucose 6-dehydrogenase